jgi:electron transport complex protein RnfE
MGTHFEPWVIMVLPPGGFLMIALLLIGKNWWAIRQERPKAERVAAIEAAMAAAGSSAAFAAPRSERKGATV